jgi:cytoskeleton protein RodZ
VTDAALKQVDAFTTPGILLCTARKARGLSEKEVADRLNWMPGYVAIVEADDYKSLRRPAFARGYIKAYGKMLGVDEDMLMDALEQLDTELAQGDRRVRTKSLQLQRTGAGVVIGLVVLLVLVAVLWWWRGEGARVAATGNPAATAAGPDGAVREGEQ